MLFVIEINFSNLNTITTQQQEKKMRLAPTAVWVSDESKSTPIIYIYTIGSARGSAVIFPTTRLVHVP